MILILLFRVILVRSGITSWFIVEQRSQKNYMTYASKTILTCPFHGTNAWTYQMLYHKTAHWTYQMKQLSTLYHKKHTMETAHWTHQMKQSLRHLAWVHICKMCMSLPFLPHEHIPQELITLRLDETITPALQSFIDYVRNTWVYRSFFHPKYWSVYRLAVKTNCESWHSRLNFRFKGENVSIYISSML